MAGEGRAEGLRGDECESARGSGEVPLSVTAGPASSLALGVAPLDTAAPLRSLARSHAHAQPARFGVVTAMFTLGCLIGSLSSAIITRRLGRVGTLRVASAMSVVSALGFGVTNQPGWMVVYR